EPVVVPVKRFRVPRQKRSFVFADATEERAYVVTSKHVRVLDGEGAKHVESFRRFARQLFNAFDTVLHDVDHFADATAAPSWAHTLQQRRRLLRSLVEHRHGRLLVVRSRNRLWLHARGNLVEDLDAGFFLLEILPLIKSDETDDPFHVVRIGITGCSLKHESRLLDASLRGDCEHHGSNLIDWRDVENQLIVRGDLCLTFADQENDRGGGRESFVPTGKRISEGGFDDARAHDTAHHPGFGRHELFAQGLRVRVDVGPTPVGGALDAEICQTRSGPDFSFARYGESESIRIVDVAAFFVETFTCEFAETRGHHRVARFVSDAVGELGAVGDLLVH